MIMKEELKKMDVASLKSEVLLLKKELFNLKLGKLTGQVKDTSQFPKLRRNIAQILTIIEQKQHASATTAKK
jgi:ribosomal protein L29